MPRMTAHELENAYDDLRAEHDRMLKALDDFLNRHGEYCEYAEDLAELEKKVRGR